MLYIVNQLLTVMIVNVYDNYFKSDIEGDF